MDLIRVCLGDITKLEVDAIVNAANELMLGGGGVDGAIHRAAGPQFYEACEKVEQWRPGVRCPTGEARITPGFDLPAKWVIHTVGPVWHGGGYGEANVLANCYRNCLELAVEHGARTLAFPAISCGVFGFPAERAAVIARREISCFSLVEDLFDEILLVGYDEEMCDVLESSALKAARSLTPPAA
ncbi:O-acetyl-ADP-ribose deacetylase [Aeoliella sp. SH292]|uniref:O-acetyl-ADP-ribose deacetylase n=1 Tax=Aeoliella sp. SH292 TaxID=3454464 RepID=UPI003F9D41BD